MDRLFFGVNATSPSCPTCRCHACPDAIVMPDLIGHLSMITERNKKRHLAWVEMPLRRISNVISHDATKLRIKLIPARINGEKEKRAL
jgi:hypothetical protein